MTRHFDIIETATGEVVKTIETSYVGGAFDRFLAGLYRKVDPDRFHVVERTEARSA